MIFRANCSRCERAFNWNSDTPKVCQKCVGKPAPVELGLWVRLYDDTDRGKKRKKLGALLKKGGLVLDRVEGEHLVYKPMPGQKAKAPSKAKCYVCADSCKHAVAIPRPPGTTSRAISDAEAGKVVLPPHRTVQATDAGFLDPSDLEGASAADYIQAMGGCSECLAEGAVAWCPRHVAAIQGRDEKTGEWPERSIHRPQVAA